MSVRRVMISAGWHGAGRQGTAVGSPVVLGGQTWTGVRWDGEEDPDWHKAAGLVDVTPDRLTEDRALVARLLKIDEGLSEWEVSFVESLAKWVAARCLTEPQRARALEIDER